MDKLHDYLYGARLTVRTDNNPLTYVLSTAKLNAVGHRWLAALSTYDFDVQYRPGRHNIDADLLSRVMPDEENTDEWVTLSESGVRAICQRVCIPESLNHPVRYVDQLGASPQCIPHIYAHPTFLEAGSLRQMSKGELRKAQERDVMIGPAIQAVKRGNWPEVQHNGSEPSPMKREMGKLTLEEGLLHRLSKRSSGEVVSQLVLPKEFREIVLKAMHDDLGHLGVERTVDQVRSRFFWPKMAKDVEQYIKNQLQTNSKPTPNQLQKHKGAVPLLLVGPRVPVHLVSSFLPPKRDQRSNHHRSLHPSPGGYQQGASRPV